MAMELWGWVDLSNRNATCANNYCAAIPDNDDDDGDDDDDCSGSERAPELR